jgi:hypothetical protein
MLGQPADSSPRDLVMLNFARERCCYPFVATTSRRGAHSGVGGRYWVRGREWKTGGLAEVACWVVVAGLGGEIGGADCLENGAGDDGALGGGGR